ncbi:MAG: hypothetical protein H0X01_01060 [Nitrospira sp.]|nr:hypothetical protein [Nitrospira sp.]
MNRLAHQEKLTELARKAYRASGLLVRSGDYLGAVNLPDHVADDLCAAQRLCLSLRHGLVALGADNPHQEETLRVYAERGLPPPAETPLHLLDSPAARRFASAIREAANACKAMETERGITDGMAEVYGDWADIAEMEVFGPVGLREGGG